MNRSILSECPNHFTNEFGKQLISALSGDVSTIKNNWCWKEFGGHFQHLRLPAEKYFEETTTGDYTWTAFCMVEDCGSSREWAEKVKNNFNKESIQ